MQMIHSDRYMLYYIYIKSCVCQFSYNAHYNLAVKYISHIKNIMIRIIKLRKGYSFQILLLYTQD